MKRTPLLIILIFAFIVILLLPTGVRAAITNNIWTISFIRQYSNNKDLDPQSFSPPSTHQHARLLLAHQALKRHDVDLASDYLTPLVNNANSLVLNTYAQVLFLQEKYPEALVIWKELGQSHSLAEAARALTGKGQIDIIILAYEYAYEIFPERYARELVQYKIEKINLLLEENHYEEAIRGYQKIITQFPEDGRPYTGLAKSYWLNNQPQQALQAIERGWDLNQDNIHFLYQAATIFEQSGFLEKALDTYQKALKVFPNYSPALKGLERLTGSNE